MAKLSLIKSWFTGRSILIITCLVLLAAGPTVVLLKYLQPVQNFLGFQRGHLMSTDTNGRWRIDSTLHADSLLFPSDLDVLYTQLFSVESQLYDSCGVLRALSLDTQTRLIDSCAVLRTAIASAQSAASTASSSAATALASATSATDSLNLLLRLSSQRLSRSVFFDDICGFAGASSATNSGDYANANATSANGGLIHTNQTADNNLAATVNMPCVLSATTGTTGNSTGYAQYWSSNRPMYLGRDWTAVFSVTYTGTHPSTLFERYWTMIGFTGNTANFPNITPASSSLFVLEWRGDSTNNLSQKLRIHMDSAGVDNIQYTSFAPVQNTWYQLKMVYTASSRQLQVYQNGTLFKTVSYVGVPLVFGQNTTRFVPFIAIGKEESMAVSKGLKVDFIFVTSMINRTLL